MLNKIFLAAVSFVFPIVCSVCGKDLPALSKARICPACKEKLPRIDGFICFTCGRILEGGGKFCRLCSKTRRSYAFDKMRSVYKYKDEMRILILKFKYSNRFYLAKDFLGDMLDVFNKNDFFKETDCIIPVPLNIVRRFRRGYNQAEVLADVLSKAVGKPLLKGILVRKKITKPQFKLSKKERAANIKDSFYARPSPLISKKNILIIDDIVTTGITASTCAAELKKAGAKKVYVLTLAQD
ncbi:MAG: ComF family protein [Elusimicrobiota bacterium]|jgi:ComF family protein|nr:ComF family protein [Elusimicrobiota bacterium]